MEHESDPDVDQHVLMGIILHPETSNECFVTAASKGNGSVACCLQRDEWNVLN